MRGLLTDERCDEIKREIVYMFEECEVNTIPINCFEICRKLYYVLKPYSSLSPDEYFQALCESQDAYCKVEVNPDTGMNQYVIYYNDHVSCIGRIRWSIFHEIGHIYLGHHDHPDDSLAKIEEAEANFFAKYAMTPPPLVNATRCTSPEDIASKFHTSQEFAGNSYSYYRKWMSYGSFDYENFELKLLQLFNLIAA